MGMCNRRNPQWIGFWGNCFYPESPTLKNGKIVESPVKMFPEKPIQRHPQIDQVGESLDVRLCQVSEKKWG